MTWNNSRKIRDMSISENLDSIKQQLPPGITLVAVSKTKPDQEVLEAYHAGHRDFGENKVQAMTARLDHLPGDIRWHMIGHLQSNKVKYIAPFVYLIHGVDSLKLLRVIDREAAKNDRIIDCLLQMYIAEEETKFGLSADELREILTASEINDLKIIRIRGLMGMATFTQNMEQVRKEFQYLRRIFEETKAAFFSRDEDLFDQLSMGMSDDYMIAAEEGSTMVRIGSLIFGPRNYV